MPAGVPASWLVVSHDDPTAANAAGTKAHGQFTTKDARIKLKKLYLYTWRPTEHYILGPSFRRNGVTSTPF